MKYVKVEDLGQIVTGNTPPTSDMSNYGNYMPFIKATDIILGSRYTYVTEQGYSEKSYKKYKANIVPKGSTCIVTIGSIGKKMTQAHTDLFVNQAINAILPYKQYDKDYIYYATKYAVLPQLKIYDSGTTSGRENISKSSFSNIRLYVEEDFSTQQKIASILSAYDRLIENNTRRIRLLEQMAENLYKEWFVRFRFPEHENVEMVNGLPKGWKIKKLGEYANISTGKCNREDAEEDGIYPLFDRSQEIKKSSKWIKDCEAIIVPGEGTSFMPRYYKGKFNLHQRCYCIEPTIKDIGFYLFYSIMLNRKYFLSVATGATVPSLRQNNFTKMKLIIAELELVKKYNKIASTIAFQIDRLKEQNTLLTRQRDLLLPRLMSGKLEVKS